MFENMVIAEYIYEGVVEPSYKNPTRSDANCDGHIRNKRGESDSSKTHSAMGEISDKRR